MRYGLLSDIHGNLAALTAAVRRLTAEGVDRWLCAGDVVGYGPQPNECVAALAALDPVCVAGNHELVALGVLPEDRCSRRARDSLRWTRSVLTGDSRRYLADLPRTASLPGLVISHGSLDDPEEYVRADEQADAQLTRLARDFPDARVLVLGHTHRAWLYRQQDGAQPLDAPVPLTAGHRYLVNPGSVGQSRQRERRPLARFALVEFTDDGEANARFFALGYDHHAVRAALRRERLPVDSMHVRPGRRHALRRRIRALIGQVTDAVARPPRG